jgi:hypothetical protein
MVKFKETWQQKMVSIAEKSRLPQVVEVTGKMSQKWGEGTVVIPSPLEVNATMKAVPEGRLMTINQIREVMAKRYNASFG